MNEIVKLKNVKKYFKTNYGLLHAVDDVTFDIYENKTLGCVGESGCGKSTLGRLIVNLLPSTEGSILYEDQDITKFSKKEMKNLRKDFQMIFQDPYSSLNPRLSVSDIIAEPLKIYKCFSKKNELTDRVRELMSTVGLASRLENAYPHELDGGRRQRVGIARALALEPKLIVCDEPVSALDVSIQAQILNLLQDLQRDRGISYFFITHDLSVVKHISDDIIVMYLGKILEKAPKKELFSQPLHPYTQSLLSAIPIPKIGAKKDRIILKGEVTSPINPAPGCRFAPRCRYATEQCFQEDPELLPFSSDKHEVACFHVNGVNGIEEIK